MSSVSYFKSISEKQAIFDRISPANFEELLKTLERYKSTGAYFRGQPDGSWRLYTSSQREWILKDLVSVFSDFKSYETEKLVYFKAQENPRLSAICKTISDISLFSAIQHYGCSTPFLDFTSSYDVALYFATRFNTAFGSLETNSFLSIYLMYEGGTPSTPFNDMTSFGSVVAEHETRMASVRASHGNIDGTDFTEILECSFWFGYELLLMKETDDWYMKIANPRSDLQNGLFVFLNNGEKPLDEYCNNKVELMVSGTTNDLALPKMVCIDIHKTMRNQILEYLESKNINDKSLGLDGNEWAKATYEKYMSSK